MDDQTSEPLREAKQPVVVEQIPSNVLEAEYVYLLMKKDNRISRNVRAQWFVSNINQIIEINPDALKEDVDDDLAVLSVIPKYPCEGWTPNTCTCFKYKILPSTSVIILARRYRLVFCLDFSSSIMTARSGEVMWDRAIISLRKCLEGLTTSFCVPGNNVLFKPQLFITVIAHTSFYLLPSQQVLVQGCLLTADNVNQFLDTVQAEINSLENHLAQISQRNHGGRYSSMSRQMSDYSLNVSHDAEATPGHNGFSNKMTVSTSDNSFVNLVRYGILALQLLPDNTSAGIVIVTDGIVNLSDFHMFHSLLTQLRSSTISCSFLHVTDDHQSSCCWGYPTYSELMKFIAVATFGAYLPIMTEESESTYLCEGDINCKSMNIYHSSILTWGFQWPAYSLKTGIGLDLLTKSNILCVNWLRKFIPNDGRKLEQKQHTEKQLAISFETLLSCRLREGYGIQSILFVDDSIEVKLVLPWKPDVNVVYQITAPWPLSGLFCRYKIIINGSYEFLHDLSCPTKKPIKSVYREIVVKKFIEALHSLSQTDNMLIHLHSLHSNPAAYQIPESIRNGVPLFSLAVNSSIPTCSTDFLQHKFTELWEPVCKLEVNIWQKWMHTHRLGLLLVHDLPLPKHLHLPNINDRYHSVQCRQALSALYTLLVEYSSFVLVENHTYINFVYCKEPDKPPTSFYIIRVTSKAPCIVIRLAFLGGTPTVERNLIVTQLREKILGLSFRSHTSVKDIMTKKNFDYPVVLSALDNKLSARCCVPLIKPVEKILIRYDRMPKELTNSVERLVFSNARFSSTSTQIKSSNMFGILCPYLYNKRWIWSASGDLNAYIPLSALGRIVSTLVKIRLNNGFHFSYSSSGVVNMVREVKMKTNSTVNIEEESNEEYSCVVQYILFPPHFKHQQKDSFSEDDVDLDEEAEELNGSIGSAVDSKSTDLQIATECWVEPQYGYVKDCSILNELSYREIPKRLWQLDFNCIATLLTFEQLILMCQNLNMTTPRERFINPSLIDQADEDANAHLILFPFHLNVLLANSSLAQLHFSTLTITNSDGDVESGHCNNLLLDLFHQNLASIHTRDVELSADEHRTFDREVRKRMAKFQGCNYEETNDSLLPFSRWKCYVKGVSATHIILTLTPDTYDDIVLLDSSLLDQSSSGKRYLLPVYVYDCSLSGIIDRLVMGGKGTNNSDLIRDYRSNRREIDAEKVYSAKEVDSNQLSSSGVRGNAARNRLFWKQHQNNVAIIFSNCYVNTIFISLQRNMFICFDDIRHAMEDKCLESCLEIDISDFLHTICYHSKNWPPTEDEESKQSGSSYVEKKSTFPKTFWSSFSCQTIASVHDLIRTNFTSIIHRLFTPIESNPNYFYFNPQKPVARILNNEVVSFDEAETEEGGLISIRPFNENEDDVPTGDRAANDNEGNESAADDDDFEVLAVDRSELMEGSEVKHDEIQDADDNAPRSPLFIRFRCTVKHDQKVIHYNIRTLPTCICEVLKNCYPSPEKINWESLPKPKDVSITLEILCLTIAANLWSSDDNNSAAMRATSFCSSSPGPQDIIEDEREDIIGAVDTVQDDRRKESDLADNINDFLDHLSSEQNRAIRKCVDEIKWMLNDEKASFARDVFPITEDILKDVTTHVLQSEGRPGCCWCNVPLNFVFEENDSLKQFEHKFQRINISSYQLAHEGDYYYLAKKRNGGVTRVVSSEPNFYYYATNEDGLLTRNLAKGQFEYLRNFPIGAVKVVGEHKEVSLTDTEEPPGEHADVAIAKLQMEKEIRSHRKSNHLRRRRRKSSLNVDSNNSIDGYDGDGSDYDNEVDNEGDFYSGRLQLPRFWLILRIMSDSVDIWFQYRNAEVKDNQLKHYKNVLEEVINHVKATCKIVNQTRLLRELCDTTLCHDLLEPETNEDLMHVENSGGGRYSNRISINGMDYYLDMPVEKRSEENTNAKSKHSPGVFSCPVVWEVSFQLHPRIKATLGPGRGTSRGVQALRSVLNPMSVVNRKNMFVYKENLSGYVFYLRLHDSSSSLQHQNISCETQISTRFTSTEEGVPSLLSSRSSSMQSLNVIRALHETIEDLPAPRFRVNSLPEKDQNHDTVSVSSKMSVSGRPRPLFDDAITLSVHGINEVGFEIRDDLVKVLQSRLDDAVLEVISLTLARNPMCKLTVEDVQFIQRPNDPPKATVYFKVAAYALPYLQVVIHYLGQNLVQFLSVPKYNDTRCENHFRRYSTNENADVDETSRKTTRDSSSAFLYIRPPEAGNRGIACIVLSLVDGKGNLVQHVNCPRPQPNSYKDGLAHHDFNTITESELLIVDSKKCPGPLALIQFQIWEKGKVDLENLIEKIRVAVRHSLWDLVTEYRVLVAPVTEIPFAAVCEEGIGFVCSEPSSPIRVKRTSLPIDSASKTRERAASPLFLLQPLSSPPPQSTNLLRGMSLVESKQIGSDLEFQIRQLEKLEVADKSPLYSLYATVVEHWLSFAFNLGVPAVFKYSFTLTSRHSIELLLKDLHKVVATLVSDSCLRVFKQDPSGNFMPLDVGAEERDRRHASGVSYLDVKVSETPGYIGRYIAVARSTKQWLLSSGHLDKENSLDITENREPLKSFNDFQRFPSLNVAAEDTRSILIPRQRFLMISVNNTQVVITIYNWAVDIQNSFLEHAFRLVDMYNVRSCYLSSIVMQKLGLFLNQPVTRAGKSCKFHGAAAERVCIACRCASADPEMLLKRTILPQGQPRRPLFQISNFTEILRGHRPYQQVNTIKLPMPGPDFVAQHITQMCQIRNSDPRDHKKLLLMWQNRESRATMPISMLKMFSRIEHYCLTPLLFHPSWRNQVAAARDHNIGCLPCSPNCIKSYLFQLQTLETTPGTRSRHSSTSTNPGKSAFADSRQSRKASVAPPQPPPKCKCIPSSRDEWHMTICLSYLGEFIQYLQTLGFVLSNTSSGRHNKFSQSKTGSKDQKGTGKSETQTDDRNSTVLFIEYLHKFLLGGIILLELMIDEPYFGIKMYIFESIRLRALEERAYSSQFVMQFLDECDKMKVSMHLHSFTYDYHLRAIHAFVSGRPTPFRIGYHAVGFLDDFLKYYQKSPNFARNLVHQGTVCVGSTTKLMQLLAHLLRHDRLYDMRGLKMISLEDPNEVEHVLVQMSTHKVSYRDASDIRQTDEFDVSLLIAKDDLSDSQIERHNLNIKYFIILTSCREMFPKSMVERQPGTFKLVITSGLPPSRPPSRPSSVQPVSSKTDVTADVGELLIESSMEESASKSTLDKSTESQFCVEMVSSGSGNTSSAGEGEKTGKADKKPRGIREENVDYMGYFSIHEDSMHNIMMEQVREVKAHIDKVMQRAMIDSQRDSCWERLYRGVGYRDVGKKDDGLGLTYSEFADLLELVHKVPLAKYDSRLEAFATNMPMNWYQTLVKVLLNKYSDCHRHFTAADGNTQYVAVLNPNVYGAFILLTVDLHSSHAEMHVVFLNDSNSSNTSVYPLVENIVNTLCFHMWSALL